MSRAAKPVLLLASVSLVWHLCFMPIVRPHEPGNARIVTASTEQSGAISTRRLGMRIPVRRREPPSQQPQAAAVQPREVCDAACPAQAIYRIAVGDNGILDFCNHHFQRLVMTFMQRGYKWIRLDER